MKKDIAILFLIVVIGVLGYFAWQAKQATAPASGSAAMPVTTTTSSTSSTTTPAPTSNTVAVAGMQQYTDTSFGFSFWYPDTWQVSTPTNPPFGVQVSGATIVKKLGLQPAGQNYPSIMIEEVHSTNRSMTDTGGAGPIGPVTYFFDPSTHLWMTTPPEGDGTTKAADISINTMGGLHMFAGTSRFDTTIMPLSADNFVVMSDGGGANATVMAKTVVASDPSVAVPVSVAQQEQIIEQEKAGIQPQ